MAHQVQIGTAQSKLISKFGEDSCNSEINNDHLKIKINRFNSEKETVPKKPKMKKRMLNP